MKNFINSIIAFLWSIKKEEWITFVGILVFSFGFLYMGIIDEHPLFYLWCMILYTFMGVYSYRRGLTDGTKLASDIWESAFIKEFFESRKIDEVRRQQMIDAFDKNNKNLNEEMSSVDWSKKE